MTDYQRHTPDPGYDPVDTRAVDRSMRAGDRTPEQIERDIEATRERMGENIDALGERLSPEHLKEQAKEAISEAAHDAAVKVRWKARSAGGRVSHAVRENAVPVGLMGAGLSWLLMKRGDHTGPRDRRRFTNGYPGPERRVSERSTSGLRAAVDKVGESIGHVAEGVGQVAQGIGHRAESVGGSVKEAAHSVSEKTGRLTRRAGDLKGEAKDRARQVGARAKGTVERNLEENPLAVAAGAAALGLALGMLLPASRREDRLMGSARDRLVDTTKETARTVKEVATEGARTEARAPELRRAARDFADTAKEAARNVAEESKAAAKDAVRRGL